MILMNRRNNIFARASGIAAVSIIVLLVSAARVSAAAAEQSVAWSTTFSPESNSKFESVHPTSDGGYIVAGSALTDPMNGREYPIVIKTDGQGNQLWNVSCDGQVATSARQTSDGGFIIASYAVTPAGEGENATMNGTAYLTKTDANGTGQWTKTIPGGMLNTVWQTPDGGFASAGWLWTKPGSDHDTDAVLMSLDPNGTARWTRTFENKAASAGLQTPDGGYVLAGTKSPFSWADTGDAFLLRLDADGRKLWNSTPTIPSITAISETADGGYILAGSYWYAKADPQGREVWKQYLQGFDGHAAMQAADGGYVIAGVLSGNALIIGTGADGTEQWRHSVPNAAVYAGDVSPDGTYIFSGVTFLSESTSAAWLMKMNNPASGQAAPGFGLAAAAGALGVAFLLKRKRR